MILKDEIREKYNFLYEMLTESGEVLVKKVKQFLEWLGFENVVSICGRQSLL